MDHVAEQIFDMPVRRGTPSGIGGLVDVVASPVYATAVGLVQCGYRNRAGRVLGSSRQAATGTFGKVTGRLHGLAVGLRLMERDMDEKREGLALRPLPVADPRVARARRGPQPSCDTGELPCEMCGAAVVAYHCRRICLHCGFMTGCSEGI